MLHGQFSKYVPLMLQPMTCLLRYHGILTLLRTWVKRARMQQAKPIARPGVLTCLMGSNWARAPARAAPDVRPVESDEKLFDVIDGERPNVLVLTGPPGAGKTTV